ncbi:hypothetical protein ST47_g9541 [Ascochyta rabiei]|uniref:Uncharacterized protein n=1 Tax=Didymella rabiei TaxID=5454 RepID=A0A162X5Y1_DIDRA|nr:hypothetical protein ST47_g9541 [Ascochyta rabiei]
MVRVSTTSLAQVQIATLQNQQKSKGLEAYRDLYEVSGLSEDSTALAGEAWATSAVAEVTVLHVVLLARGAAMDYLSFAVLACRALALSDTLGEAFFTALGSCGVDRGRIHVRGSGRDNIWIQFVAHTYPPLMGSKVHVGSWGRATAIMVAMKINRARILVKIFTSTCEDDE